MLRASVVIPSFNKRDALIRTLAGFNNQSFPAEDFEVIVVDDGSTDQTEAWIASLETRFRLLYFKQENGGRARARNAGIRQASGDIILMNDADAIPSPRFVEHHVRLHEQESDRLVGIGAKYEILAEWNHGIKEAYLERVADMFKSRHQSLPVPLEKAMRGEEVPLFSDLDVVENWGAIQSYVLRKAYHNFDAIYEVYSERLDGFLIPWVLFVTANVSVARDTLIAVGLFDEDFQGWGLEDTELGYRLHRHGVTFRYDVEAANYHQMHPIPYTERRQQRAHNYELFSRKHPSIEVFLFWRFTNGDLDADTYNHLLVEYAGLEDQGVPKMKERYLALSRRMAEAYTQDTWISKEWRNFLEAPESLRVSD
jgi:glycosyltransferase involved in cell wall biosynthesis